MEFWQEIEQGLDKTYLKSIRRPFMAGVREYDLVSEGDRIAVCISGGKDSMLLSKLMQNLQRHSPKRFELRFICMDPGYTAENRQRIAENCALLNIPVEFFDTDIFEAVGQMDCNMCFMCAKMRRGYLYRYAKSIGCSKIALGHHFDDVVETTMLNLIYAGRIQTMLPQIESDHVEGMRLIRPMYRVRESEIIRWRDENGLTFLNCACRRTERGAQSDSKRLEMKRLIADLERTNPDAARNIFRSMHNIDPKNGISACANPLSKPCE